MKAIHSATHPAKLPTPKGVAALIDDADNDAALALLAAPDDEAVVEAGEEG